MRSIWKGAITFGLVNVPVKVYSATEDHDIALHQVHDADGGRIRYQRRCEVCGQVIDFEHIDKAFDDGERTVVITADDISTLPAEKSREIDVVEFVPSDQVDPIRFDRSYFLEPDSKSSKAYVLLRETLGQTDRTAIVKFALRQKSRLAALRVHGDVLLLQTLLWDDEVRDAQFTSLADHPTISAKELEMSARLVDSYSADFEPQKFSDDYQVQLRQLIDAKLEHGDSIDTEATFGQSAGDSDDGAGGEGPGGEGPGGDVIDLMEALRRSVERSRAEKSQSADSDGDAGATKQTKAKRTAKKSAAAS
ncbi:Ku protein [Subtercola sp. PAMC28395]|uniref:non-homologous end joining protein Ku n=1 Tax=Subtercola sp. PAMC28395 TaxID=2846775 RepID=UPI001C0BA753|nr:Ku protein [Subtercola sp. PAMC28395]QWT23667.1 Ku protein [Subtercola sp. PAMC28395]